MTSEPTPAEAAAEVIHRAWLANRALGEACGLSPDQRNGKSADRRARKQLQAAGFTPAAAVVIVDGWRDAYCPPE